MKYIPILFSTPMVQALLDGRKTVTRRVLKPQPEAGEDGWLTWAHKDVLANTKVDDFGKDPLNAVIDVCPYGKVGDVLWVRETCQQECELIQIAGGDWSNAYYNATGRYVYKADGVVLDDIDSETFGKWRPSIFMPKDACRIFLKVTEVRVERLHDITRGDAMAEGCPFPNLAKETNPVGWFSSLWQTINGTESWNANPWVWVISFKKIEKPDNFN